MRRLPAVEQARAVMTEGMDWSAWRWLLERARVREIADRATAALNRADKQVKSSWPEDLKLAYAEVLAEHPKGRSNHNATQGAGTDAEVRAVARRIKEMDERAERCRLRAEDLFAEAEERFSAEMARAGARKALETYDLREAAIRTSETAAGEEQPAHAR